MKAEQQKHADGNLDNATNKGIPDTKAKPATALPWEHTGTVYGYRGIPYQEIRGPDVAQYVCSEHCGIREEDAAYIVHAANSYPKLVASLANCVWQMNRATTFDGNTAPFDSAESLLRELGELE